MGSQRSGGSPGPACPRCHDPRCTSPLDESPEQHVANSQTPADKIKDVSINCLCASFFAHLHCVSYVESYNTFDKGHDVRLTSISKQKNFSMNSCLTVCVSPCTRDSQSMSESRTFCKLLLTAPGSDTSTLGSQQMAEHVHDTAQHNDTSSPMHWTDQDKLPAGFVEMPQQVHRTSVTERMQPSTIGNTFLQLNIPTTIFHPAAKPQCPELACGCPKQTDSLPGVGKDMRACVPNRCHATCKTMAPLPHRHPSGLCCPQGWARYC